MPDKVSDWFAVTVEFEPAVDAIGLDIASGELFELGAEGIEQHDDSPIRLVASFQANQLPEAVVGLVQSTLVDRSLPVADVRMTAWPNVDWATHWRRHFHPLDFGPVWVVPHWLEAPDDAEVVLRIDPSMAFGTGIHPSTALCLERIIALRPIMTMLDVGTGTGILALAAAAFGTIVCAIDIDPDAVEVAKKNAVDNGMADRIEFAADGEVTLDEMFPVVVANIIAGPLIALAERIAARVAPGGILLLSGLLEAQGDEVEAVYRASGLTPSRRHHRDGWVCLEMFRAP